MYLIKCINPKICPWRQSLSLLQYNYSIQCYVLYRKCHGQSQNGTKYVFSKHFSCHCSWESRRKCLSPQFHPSAEWYQIEIKQQKEPSQVILANLLSKDRAGQLNRSRYCAIIRNIYLVFVWHKSI